METDKRKTILLVEDEPITALAERGALQRFGYAVVPARNGEEAVGLAATLADIDLVLMDIDLGPGIDGTEAAALILRKRDLPVVFLSSHTEPEIVEKTEKITSYGYVVKNSSTTVLDASIKMAFKLFEAKAVAARAEARRTALIANITDVIVVLDGDAVVRYLSPNCVRWFGWTPEALTGGSALAAVHPDDREAFRRFLADLAARPGASGGFEGRLVRGGGDATEAEIFVTNLLDDPAVGGLLGNFRDIGDRKRAEAGRRESVDRLSAFFGAMSEMAVLHEIVYGPDGRAADYRILDCNRAFSEITGIARSDAVGRLATEVYGSAEAPYLETYAAVAAYGEAAKYETYYAPMDKHFAISVVSPRPGQFATVTTDITALKRTEAALEAKLAENEAYFEASLEMLSIADRAGNFIRVNPEWERALGYSRAELLNRPYLDFVHPDDRAATLAAAAALNAGGPLLSFANRYRRKDGAYRWLEWRSIPAGDVIYAAAHDITELKRIAAEKELLLKEVHHRMKNNIAGVEGLLDMQADGVADPAARAALRDAVGRMRSMRLLYENLFVSENYAEGSTKDYLEKIVSSVADLFPNRAEVAVAARVEDFALPSKRLFSLGIIVNELLTNALRYAFVGRTHGSVEIELVRSEGRAALRLADDGVGLAADRAASDGGAPAAGGFGLSMVGMLAGQLEGSFDCAPAAGGGTVCRVEFPA